MTRNSSNTNRELFDLLQSRGYSPKVYGVDGKEVPVPEQGEVFQFHFHKDAKDYGTVTASVDGLRNLIVYYGDDVAHSDKSKSGDETWYQLLRRLKGFAISHQLGFELSNMDKMTHDMAKRKHREQMVESYYSAGDKKSCSDSVPSVKIVIHHSRTLAETEQRHRAIDKMFVENTSGERFLLPTKSTKVAKAFARHVAEGGNIYDSGGEHITRLAEELRTLNKFCKTVNESSLSDDATDVVTHARDYRQLLSDSIAKLASRRGYGEYFKSQVEFTDPTMSVKMVAKLFETDDDRVTNAFPILRRFGKKTTALEQWANKVVKESLYPSSPMDVDKLVALMDNPLVVGADAMNALSMLTDIIEDDELTQSLKNLAKRSPTSDARATITSWIQQQSDPQLKRVATSLTKTEVK